MNAHPYPTDEPLCAVAMDLLQRRLDGETVATPPEVAVHVAGCAGCRGRFSAADQMLDGLNGFDFPISRRLTECIVAGAITDLRRRRRLRRWSCAAAGLAAGVMTALWVIHPPAPMPHTPEVAQRAAPPNLRLDFAEAGEAVASLTRRTAADALASGRQLIPSMPAPWPPALKPTPALDEAGAGLAEGFEPVTTSARRAAQMFLGELPTATEKVD